jgi:hypothetical protein
MNIALIIFVGLWVVIILGHLFLGRSWADLFVFATLVAFFVDILHRLGVASWVLSVMLLLAHLYLLTLVWRRRCGRR